MSAACYRERSPAYACKENNRGPQMTTLHMIKPTKACWSKPLTRSQRKLVTQALSVSLFDCMWRCKNRQADDVKVTHCTKLNNPSLPCVLLSDTPLKIQQACIRHFTQSLKCNWVIMTTTFVPVQQGSPGLGLEGRSTAEFGSYPDQTHLSKLIKVFMITRKSQVW